MLVEPIANQLRDCRMLDRLMRSNTEVDMPFGGIGHIRRPHFADVSFEPRRCGVADRHDSILPSLRLLDEELTFGEVDVFDLQSPDFAGPECRRIRRLEDAFHEHI